MTDDQINIEKLTALIVEKVKERTGCERCEISFYFFDPGWRVMVGYSPHVLLGEYFGDFYADGDTLVDAAASLLVAVQSPADAKAA